MHLLQFCADLFEILQVFRSWPEDVYCLDITLRLLLSPFSQNELSNFCSQSDLILDFLCWQLLLQCFADSFGTVHVIGSLSENVHIIWI